jgi:hypothetical protein
VPVLVWIKLEAIKNKGLALTVTISAAKKGAEEFDNDDICVM